MPTGAHILVAFLAYCLLVTLKNRLQALAPGLTPRAVLEKLATIQMLEVWLPTTDGRWLVMPRFTQPEADQVILLHKLKLVLRISACAVRVACDEKDEAKESERNSFGCIFANSGFKPEILDY